MRGLFAFLSKTKVFEMKKIMLFACIIAVIAISGCVDEEPTRVNITDNITDLQFILLDQEGTIFQELCSERNLTDKIIVLESKYCGACRVAIPRLKEIEEDLQAEFIFLDLSQECDMERMKQFRIVPQYTPTVLIGCDVYIGAYPKDSYKQWIEAFLNK